MPRLDQLLPDVEGNPTLIAHFAEQITAAALLSNGRCCEGLISEGQFACTCWVEVHDVDQVDPIPDVIPSVMARPCGDCAYRKDSPERRGHPEVRGDDAFLNRIVADGEAFWCHDGMRQVIALAHPTGARLEIPRDVSYEPPIVAGRPYRANGTLGALCAGWSARRLKHVLTHTLQETS